MDTPMSNASFNLENIDELPENLIIQPTHPVSIFIQEAKNLEEWIKTDIQLLTSRGLEQRYIDSLPRSISTCSLAQAKWLSELKINRKLVKDQNKKVAEYYEFSIDLIHEFRYAFRNSPDLLETVANIEKGRSKAFIVQRLSDLSILGNSNVKQLKNINFDLVKLEIAATYSKELATLIAIMNANSNQKNTALDSRNRAYSILKIIVAEIRRCGSYLFWQTPDRLIGYRSEYNRKQYLKSKARKIKNSSNIDKD